MENFEEAIKDYVHRVHDKDNPAIYWYVLNRQFRRHYINITQQHLEGPPEKKPLGRRNTPVITPIGRFANAEAAGIAHGVSDQTIVYRIKTRKVGYRYADKETTTD